MNFNTLRIVILLANSADPNEMPHFASFHLCPYYLPKFPFRGFPYTKGLENIYGWCMPDEEQSQKVTFERLMLRIEPKSS